MSGVGLRARPRVMGTWRTGRFTSPGESAATDFRVVRASLLYAGVTALGGS